MLIITILNSEEGPPTTIKLSFEKKIAVKQGSISDSQEDGIARTQVLDCYRNDTANIELGTLGGSFEILDLMKRTS